jgi:cell wall-associated NlpC family hydrolase
MNKNLAVAAAITSLIFTTGVVAPVTAAPNDISVRVNNNIVSFPVAAPFIDQSSGRTFVPIRFVAEQLGAKVDWNGGKQQVTVLQGDKNISLVINQPQAIVNGNTITFDSSAEIQDNRTFVPLRFLSETLGAKVNWDNNQRLVDIHVGADVTTTSPPTTITSTGQATNNSKVNSAWEVKADAIIATGMKYLGTPYVFGGSDPLKGFDCSGFTQYVFGQNGISLPHSAVMQSQMDTPVSKDQLRKGDLVFLQGTYTAGVSHVAIYMGNNQVLQAGTMDGKRAVKISTLFGTPYYDAHYWGAQRIIN